MPFLEPQFSARLDRERLDSMPLQPTQSRRRSARSRNEVGPGRPVPFYLLGGFALAAFADGRYAEAIEWPDRALHELPIFAAALRLKVAACGLLERPAEGQEALGRLLEFLPGYSVARFTAFARSLAPEVVALYAEGSRKAGGVS